MYIYILDVKMELKLHLYSITWVTSMLKPGIWNLELGTWALGRGTWHVSAKARET